jgi:hypothetical protein
MPKQAKPATHIPRALVLAFAVWMVFAATAQLDMGPLAFFAVLYALLTYVSDREVHAWFVEVEPLAAVGFALALDAALPAAPAVIAPAALLFTVAAIEIAVRRRLRPGRARSPGARPAAT